VISCLFTIFVQFIFILTMVNIPELIKGYAVFIIIYGYIVDIIVGIDVRQ